MRSSFSNQLYLRDLDVNTLMVPVARNAELSCCSELRSVFVASLVNLIFLTILTRGLTGQYDVPTTSRLYNQLLSRRALAAMPRVPVTARLSAD